MMPVICNSKAGGAAIASKGGRGRGRGPRRIMDLAQDFTVIVDKRLYSSAPSFWVYSFDIVRRGFAPDSLCSFGKSTKAFVDAYYQLGCETAALAFPVTGTVKRAA